MSTIGLNSLLSGSTAGTQFVSLVSSPSSNSGAPAASSSADDPIAATGVSPFSRLLSKLQDLSQTDPSQFKSLTAQIASQLQAAAGNAKGSHAQALATLAADFTQASQNGNLSSLEPSAATQTTSVAHHHHRHAAEAYQASATPDGNTDAAQSIAQTLLSQTNIA